MTSAWFQMDSIPAPAVQPKPCVRCGAEGAVTTSDPEIETERCPWSEECGTHNWSTVTEACGRCGARFRVRRCICAPCNMQEPDRCVRMAFHRRAGRVA